MPDKYRNSSIFVMYLEKFNNMKKIYISVLSLFIGIYSLTAQVGIGTTTPNANAVLDVTSTTQGVAFPRVSNLSGIVNPATGLTVFDVTSDCLAVNVGTPAVPVWECMDTTSLPPFISIWDTTKVTSGATNEITLPLSSSGGDYNFTVDWGDGSTSLVTTNAASHTYATAGIYTLTITGKIIGWEMIASQAKKITDITQWGCLKGAGTKAFYQCTSLTTISATDTLNTQGITSFFRQFYGCEFLTALDVSNWDVSSATNFEGQFHGCKALTTLDVSNWNVSSGTNFYSQFSTCLSLTTLDVSNWDVSSATNFYRQFYRCESLTALDVSNWDVSSVTIFYQHFYQCESLITLDVSNWNVSSATSFYGQFSMCRSLTTLDVSNWNVSSATSFERQFNHCESLTALDVSNWDVSSATNFNSQFYGCLSLTALDVSNWDVSLATNLYRQFYRCESLTTLDVSNWNVGLGINFSTMFSQCSSLTTLDVSNWDVSSGTNFNNFLYGTTLSTAVYDQTLIKWEALTLQPGSPGQSIHFGLSKYTSGGLAQTARTNIINNDGWAILDGGAL